jgi:hypothetical protein
MICSACIPPALGTLAFKHGEHFRLYRDIILSSGAKGIEFRPSNLRKNVGHRDILLNIHEKDRI